MMPSAMLNAADQCRAMGLSVGDTIEGTEHSVGYWRTARLTLLWLGETTAVWSESTRSSKRPDWSGPRETANWNLGFRAWEKV